MNTFRTETITPANTGDVIEITLDGSELTALVLLAAEEMMILDLCDGSTPVVVRYDEVPAFRVFSPETLSLSLAA